ncbi:MAG TPA: lipid A deacylase LpxR family protein [Candidatus Polarisedimenticolia bacterium]|nr:lipid A deacylase LpxR family protein [Candidatus Polarisedimenticolia bacterium]
MRRHRALAAVAALLIFFAAAAPTASAAASEPPTGEAAHSAKDFRDLYLFRFEFDNDSFIGSDDSFTAGWSFQLHSPFEDTWKHGFGKWIGRVPSLGDDGTGGRITRWAAGLGQIIITPTDISIEAPQPEDAPWAGILTAAMSWSAYDNRKMAALQLLGGCMGPCSGAESVQKFIHEDLGFGEPPQGWDNQLVNQALVNANYEYRYKVLKDHPEEYFNPRKFAHDLSVGGMAAAGNLATYAGAQVEYRFGWGLPMGFTKTPDPIGLGVMLDPVYAPPGGPLPSEARRWRTYFTLMGRYAYIWYLAPAEGGETVNGGEHPKLDAYPGESQFLGGFHLARIPFAFHVTYYRYFQQDRVGTDGSSDWINVSFEYRF